jgi:hypothetical protein
LWAGESFFISNSIRLAAERLAHGNAAIIHNGLLSRVDSAPRPFRCLSKRACKSGVMPVYSHGGSL